MSRTAFLDRFYSRSPSSAPGNNALASDLAIWCNLNARLAFCKLHLRASRSITMLFMSTLSKGATEGGIVKIQRNFNTTKAANHCGGKTVAIDAVSIGFVLEPLTGCSHHFAVYIFIGRARLINNAALITYFCSQHTVYV